MKSEQQKKASTLKDIGRTESHLYDTLKRHWIEAGKNPERFDGWYRTKVLNALWTIAVPAW